VEKLFMNFGPIVVIPSRYQSSRFPGKPLAMIKNMSLLERTYRQVLLCPHVAACYIATDDERIYNHAQEFGASAIMTSPDCQNGTERIAEAIRSSEELQKAPMIVNVQGDEPCIDPATISKVITTLLLNSQASVATIVSPIKNEQELTNPNIVKCVRTLDGSVLYFSRAAIPGTKKTSPHPLQTYFRHIGIFAYRPDFLIQFALLPPTPLQLAEDLETLKAIEHGYCVVAAEVDQHGPDVNVPQDIEEVVQWIENQSFSS
jgi:3-deoxy-manno-octulosonate cytidylyltransferase (CMP-KDO synthetase)